MKIKKTIFKNLLYYAPTIIKSLLILPIGVNIYFSAYWVINKDLFFHTDIARDFLIFREIAEKKLILIGPRSSTSGLFHGPLWHYLNYPAFVLGNGDPVTVGWFWIILIIIFLLGSYYVARKLLNPLAGIIYVLFLSGNLVYYGRALFNPHGALFLMPLFIYTIIKYLENGKFKYLFSHFLLIGFIFQFQIAIGSPLLLLSLLFITVSIIKKKKFSHFFAVSAFFLATINFLIFELRHNFLMLHSVLAYLTPLTPKGIFNYSELIFDRWHYLSELFLLNNAPLWQKTFLFFITIFSTAYLYKKGENRKLYPVIYYFIGGFILLSFVNKGGILSHQIFPLMGLTILLFASLFDYKKHLKMSLVLSLLLIFIIQSNISLERSFIKNSKTGFGKDPESWQFLKRFGMDLFNNNDEEFGYFVYSPDAFGYQPSYAVHYAASNSPKIAYSFKKMPVTYLVIAPPPPDKPGMKDDWWRINQVKIYKKPDKVIKYDNGYKIERYSLNKQDVKIPFNPVIDIGLHFR